MSTRAFAAVRRHAADGVSRRTSLLTLGGAALAAVATLDVSEAKKKKGKDCKKKAKQRCSNDVASCTALIPAVCSGDPTCIAKVNLCCETCSGNGFLTCLLAAANATAIARLK
jgi:hypothetical protein